MRTNPASQHITAPAILGNPTGTFTGVGFALPVDTVRGIVDQIIRTGKVTRPVLGVAIAPADALRQIGVKGVLILSAPPGSPAGAAGARLRVRPPALRRRDSH